MLTNNLIGLDANWDGKGNCATSASATRAASTGRASSLGSATATKDGAVYFAIRT